MLNTAGMSNYKAISQQAFGKFVVRDKSGKEVNNDKIQQARCNHSFSLASLSEIGIDIICRRQENNTINIAVEKGQNVLAHKNSFSSPGNDFGLIVDEGVGLAIKVLNDKIQEVKKTVSF